LIAHYTHGLGLTSRIDATGQAAYYDFDGLGSTVGMSGASGSYQNQYRYLPFGESLTASGVVPNPFQFVGQFGVMTQPNGLEFMGARFYASTQGRFLQHDPLGLNGKDPNIYRYNGNDPVDRIDPGGLDGVDAGFTPPSAGLSCGILIGCGGGP